MRWGRRRSRYRGEGQETGEMEEEEKKDEGEEEEEEEGGYW